MNPTAPTRDFTSPAARNLFWAITVGIWAVLGSVLIVTGQSRWAYTLSRAVFIRIDVEILLVLAVALALLDRRFRPPLTPLAWSVLGYCGALLLATAFSLDSYQSWWGTLERMDGTFTKLHYAVFFLILTGVFRTCRDWTNFLHASLAVSVLVAGKAVAERLSTGLSRVASTIGDPALTATYALLQIFFAALVTAGGRTRTARLWGGAAMLLNVVTLLLTGDRGATIGLGAGALAVGLTVALSSRYSTTLRRAALAGTLLLLVVPFAVYAARGTPLVRWNTALERLSQLSPHDSTTRTRLITLGVSWRAFKARPLLGYGPELYTLASVRHFNPDILTYEQGWWDRSHNTLTDRLVMEGAIGLLAYLSIFVAAGLMLVRAFRLEPHGKLTVPITAGMLSAYIVQNLFLFDSPSSYLLFFAVLAFVSFLVTGGSHTEPREVAEQAKRARIGTPAAAVRRRASPSPSGGRRGETTSSVRRFPRRGKVLIAGLALFVLVTIYNANLKGLAEAFLGDALVASIDDPHRFQELFGQTVAYGSWAQDEVVATAADALRAVGAGNPAYLAASTEVAAQLEAQVGAHRHPDPRALIRLGSLYQAMAVADPTCLPKAEKAFQKAIELAPKWPESYDGLGATYLTEGKVEEALALLKRAVEINPSNGTARWMYAFPLIWSHRAEGLAELEAALHNYNYYNRVDLKRLVNTYYQLHDLPRSIQFQLELTQLEPGDAVHHATLARLYKESGNTEGALQEIRTAAQLDPRYRAAAGDLERGR